jgi:antitoxin HicB
MRFIIDGRGYEINRESIVSATKGVPPKAFDGRNKYYVEVHGLRYPIKQIVHLVTRLPYAGYFNAQYAQHILKKLGFVVQTIAIVDVIKPVPSTSKGTNVVEGVMKFAITLEQDEDGYIVASVPALPGCYSQGKNEEEAIANIKEAIRGYIASMRKHGEPIPSITEVREVEVAV